MGHIKFDLLLIVNDFNIANLDVSKLYYAYTAESMGFSESRVEEKDKI